MLLKLDVRRDAASNARAASAEHGSASDRRTPRPWTFFGVAAGLLACRSSSHPAFPMRGRISDSTIGSNSLLTVAGAAPDSRRLSPDTPASLLATKSCDLIDRDGYMWCYSCERVNGVEMTFARQFQKFLQNQPARGSRTRFCLRLEEVFPDIPGQHSPVTSWRRAQSGIASRRFAAPGRSGERRAARNPGARRPCNPSRSALHSRS